MADIGITYSSNPSRLIQQSGEFLSNNIRDIGKQIQGTILEINTKKDLARFAQNLQQNVNPNSDDFAQQAVQVAANHPLATQDPRGQIALNILGKAHGEWKQAQLAVDRYNNPVVVPGVGLTNRTTGQVIRGVPPKTVTVGRNSRLVDAVTGEGIVDPLPEPEVFVNTPGGPMNRSTGLDVSGNPIVPPQKGAMTDAQAQKARLESVKAQQIATGKMRDDLRQKLNANRAREAAFMKLDEPTRQQRVAELAEIHKERKSLELMDSEAVGALNGYIQELQTLGDVESAAILPPVSELAAAPNDELVAVFNPQGQPKKIKRSQLEAALKNGYKQR